MLRFKILASTLPLILAAFFSRGELIPSRQACITIGETSVQLATTPWQAQTKVAFTDDASRATVRVQIVETPETADFAVADDIDSDSDIACGATAATRLISISSDAGESGPVIYLTRDDGADYRVYVHSRNVTPRDAAALLVGAQVAGANGGHRRVAEAAL